MDVNKILYEIKGICIEISKMYGSIMLEEAYKKVLTLRLSKKGHTVQREVKCNIYDSGEVIENAYRIDMIVDGCVIIELKTVSKILPVHVRQLHTYMRLTGLPAGLLINFGAEFLYETGIQTWLLKDLR